MEAVKHETWAASPLAFLLIQSSLASPRLAHNLYWLLTQALPGVSPQVSLHTSSNCFSNLSLTLTLTDRSIFTDFSNR